MRFCGFPMENATCTRLKGSLSRAPAPESPHFLPSSQPGQAQVQKAEARGTAGMARGGCSAGSPHVPGSDAEAGSCGSCCWSLPGHCKGAQRAHTRALTGLPRLAPRSPRHCQSALQWAPFQPTALTGGQTSEAAPPLARPVSKAQVLHCGGCEDHQPWQGERPPPEGERDSDRHPPPHGGPEKTTVDSAPQPCPTSPPPPEQADLRLGSLGTTCLAEKPGPTVQAPPVPLTPVHPSLAPQGALRLLLLALPLLPQLQGLRGAAALLPRWLRPGPEGDPDRQALRGGSGPTAAQSPPAGLQRSQPAKEPHPTPHSGLQAPTPAQPSRTPKPRQRPMWGTLPREHTSPPRSPEHQPLQGP